MISNPNATLISNPNTINKTKNDETHLKLDAVTYSHNPNLLVGIDQKNHG
jgi:hypothetical protein